MMPFYVYPTYSYPRLGMGLSVLPAVWQHFIDILFENILNRERYKIIMDDAMVFTRKEQPLGDLANLFKALVKFLLKISPYTYQFFRDQLTYMGLTFMLKDGKLSYTPMREKCAAIIKLKLPKSVEYCKSFCSIVTFLSSFFKNLRKHLILIYGLQKKKNKFQWIEEYQRTFQNIKNVLITPHALHILMENDRFR